MISMEPGLSPPTTMRRKKKERRGWRKKKRKPALPNTIPGFVAASAHHRIWTWMSSAIAAATCSI
jgi:hypothetical protein